MIIGAYLRLSDDDNDITDFKQESNSISAQRNLINSYISNNHELCGSTVKEFCDDGYTGVNFYSPFRQQISKVFILMILYHKPPPLSAQNF